MNLNSETEIKAIENPSLVEAINSHRIVNSDESAGKLINELLTAKYLAPMVSNNMNIVNGVAQQGSTFSLGLIKDEQGLMLLPLFTDWLHLNKSSPGSNGFVLTAESAYSMAIEQFDGVVVNPSGFALPLYKNFLQTLLQKINT